MHQTAPCSPHIIAYWKALPRWKCLWPVIKITRTLDELRLAYSPNPKTYPQAPAGTDPTKPAILLAVIAIPPAFHTALSAAFASRQPCVA